MQNRTKEKARKNNPQQEHEQEQNSTYIQKTRHNKQKTEPEHAD